MNPRPASPPKVSITLSRLALLAVAALLAAACKDKSALGEGGRETSGAYVTGYNEIVSRVPGFLETYYRAVGDEPGPDNLPRAKTSLCVGIWVDTEKVKQAFDAAADGAGEELEHLEAPAGELLAAVTEIDEARTRLCNYLEAEDYKDDDFAGAREIHERLGKATDRYSKSVNALSVGLGEVEDRQIVADIAKYESKKNASYWYRSFSYRSKKLIEVAERDPSQMVAAYEAWLPDYEGLTKFTSENQEKLNASFTAYQKQADRFANSAKKLRREIAAAETDADREAATSQHMSGLISAYNTLIGFHEGFASLEEHGKLEN